MLRPFLWLLPIRTLLFLPRVDIPLEVEDAVPRGQPLLPVELLYLGDQLGEVGGLVAVQLDLFEGPDDDPDIVDVPELEAAAHVAFLNVEDDPGVI